MNNSPKSIMFKLCALFSFIVFCAGGFMAFYGYSGESTPLFIAGIIVTVVGFYTTAVFAVYVGKHNGERDLHDITLFKAFKAAFMFSVLGGMLIFGGLAIILGIENGSWQLAVAGVCAIILMIVVGYLISLIWRKSSMKKVKADKNATEYTGVIQSIQVAFMVSFLGSASRVTYRFNIKVEGHTAIAFVERNSPAYANYVKNKSREVKVKFNPDKPQYCIVLE
ncbi:MAG: hypothetical protein K2O41_00465 [Clostridia bacterium]|nr:hypothetical protein [Clostridia bacterium]